jgi:hypothetical protein
MRYFSKPLSPPLSKGGRGDGEGFGVRAVPYRDEKRYISWTGASRSAPTRGKFNDEKSLFLGQAQALRPYKSIHLDRVSFIAPIDPTRDTSSDTTNP